MRRVSTLEPEPAPPAANPLFRELLWVHSMIRRDLDTVRGLAEACAEGADTEDVAVFPTLRRLDPDLGPTIDRLEADHREVAALLDRVEDRADALAEGDGSDTRSQLVVALESLGETLLAHLTFEEENLEAPLGRMRTWVG
jgi:hemerythrin-like domain-containing protein